MVVLQHQASKDFWLNYQALPLSIQKIADKQFTLLQQSPQHPSLHLKKVGRLYSVRVNENYRALALRRNNTLLWIWIGTHDVYERFIKRFS